MHPREKVYVQIRVILRFRELWPTVLGYPCKSALDLNCKKLHLQKQPIDNLVNLTENPCTVRFYESMYCAK